MHEKSRAIQSQFKFPIDTLQDFGTMPIFKRTFTQDLDLLEQHLIKEIISQIDCKTILTKLKTTFENAFNSEFKERMQKYTRFDVQSFKDAMICNMDSIGKYMLEIILHQQWTLHLLKQKKLMQTQEDHLNLIQALNIDSLKVDLVVIQNTCSKKEDTNLETASNKPVKESSFDSATKDVHAIKYKIYQSLSACFAQVLWMRTQLTDYGFHFDKIPMYCDSKAAIAISCNPVQHSRTKHIDVRYHFINEKVEKGIVELFFVGTEYQLADLFTKALLVERFQYLVRRLGMRYLNPVELEALVNEFA
nr:retrovirus-related Pol polyprotein from transposon TNT 1-94 [Tanacetum cinerariifolium]